ncbi:MAG TPA: RIP metalloprotease [Caulobacteraceae bacterium]|nr:RIP metalloprotease [Caulobacteraceae bacterium]
MIAPISFVLTYVLPFAVVLGVIITIHELGHYFAGRIFGVAIDRFAIGFGRAIASRTDKRGVEWRIGWIPLGGYVRFSGDSNDASLPDGDELEQLRQQIIERHGPEAVQRYYHFKPVWQRAVIAAAGPIANFLLAVVVFWALVLVRGDEPHQLARVASVDAGTPAAAAGFRPGDLVVRANGHRIRFTDDLAQYNALRSGEKIDYLVDRGGQRLVLTAAPSRQVEEDQTLKVKSEIGHIGLHMSDDPRDRVVVHYNPITAIGEAAFEVWDNVDVTLTYLRRVATGYENGSQLSGIIGMGYVSGKVVASTPHAMSLGRQIAILAYKLASLTGLVSVGIGFVNLLPIPLLDGGHLAFYAYEAVARRPLSANIQAASYRVGLALVLGLMLFATWNDLQRLRAFHFLGGLFS